jgi:hypothetical protein
MVKAEIEGGPDRLRRLIQKTDRYQIGVKTWGELIDENKARLQFFQEHLQHSADKTEALAFLKQKYAHLLVGVSDEEHRSVGATSVEEEGQDDPDGS